MQQIVGGFLLAGPFVVTEEVWNLAKAMNWLQGTIAVFVVTVIGYGALYQADEERDVEKETKILWVPRRFWYLMGVSYGSVAILAFLFAAPMTFDADAVTTVKAIIIGAIFSVVGAATADSLF